MFLASKRDERRISLLLASITLIAGALMYPFFLGRTHLDPGRTTTHAALFVALGITVVMVSCARRRKILLWSGPVILGLSVLMQVSSYRQPTYLCCSPSGFEAIHREVAEIARGEGLPRPTVANVDLGVMS